MSELFHECGVAAIYHLDAAEPSPLCPEQGIHEASRLLPRMLLDIQNRGQLAAGISTFRPQQNQLLTTYKDIGTVSEVFRLSHRGKAENLMRETAGRAGIGHVRYATCGRDDRNYAQPFERVHLQRHKWFTFCFNGQLANYSKLKDELQKQGDYYFSRDADTEIIMHEIGRELSGDQNPGWLEVLRRVSRRFDGAYSLALLNSSGEMVVARDPLGIKPMCWAKEGPLFAAASESVALLNLGFDEHNIHSLAPGHAILISPNSFEIQCFAEAGRTAHCFFEWIYFANVASTLDDRSVYLTRTGLGTELARLEREEGIITVDEDTIVVPVPDTSKAAADAMAFELGVPSREGLIRNRYSGRTFIEGGQGRKKKAETKYTPLREVMGGKRVILVEDSIVRSTTMKVLIDRIYERGGAKEIHVRVACPPILAPCFYGIDMSTIGELFAPRFMDAPGLTREIQDRMAAELGCDSLRYLPVEALARAVGRPAEDLCQACVTGTYPTPYGQQLYQIARTNQQSPGSDCSTDARTYESSVR